MRAQISSLCVLTAFVLLAVGCSRKRWTDPAFTVPPSSTAAYEEFAADDITVTDARGGPVALSDYLGRPVILSFWASWAVPSQDELPALQRAYDVYGEDIAFLVVNMTDGSRETRDSADAYILEQGFTFPILYDLDGTAAAAYGAGDAPATIFIDADGFIVTRSAGLMDEEALLFGLKLL